MNLTGKDFIFKTYISDMGNFKLSLLWYLFAWYIFLNCIIVLLDIIGFYLFTEILLVLLFLHVFLSICLFFSAFNWIDQAICISSFPLSTVLKIIPVGSFFAFTLLPLVFSHVCLSYILTYSQSFLESLYLPHFLVSPYSSLK